MVGEKENPKIRRKNNELNLEILNEWKRMILEGRGTDVPHIGINNVASSKGKGTDPNVDETVWICMRNTRVTAISRTEILVHCFWFLTHGLPLSSLPFYQLLCKPSILKLDKIRPFTMSFCFRDTKLWSNIFFFLMENI